jgi:hypothetical protein
MWNEATVLYLSCCAGIYLEKYENGYSLSKTNRFHA